MSLPPLAAEPGDSLRHQGVIDLMNLDAVSDAGEKRDREFATEMLLELTQSGEDREPTIGIPYTQGMMPERKTKGF